MSSQPTLDPSNPFATPSALPHGLPDYAAIREEHYLPAFLAGLAEQRAEVAAIASGTEPPTVENTLVALERSGRLLERLGFEREGYARRYLCIAGAWEDHVLTALVRPGD